MPPEGDIIYLRAFRRDVIILNKFEHARELLDRRGSAFSDRPRMVAVMEMCVSYSDLVLGYDL